VSDDQDGFERFAAAFGPRLYRALVPVGGIDLAHDATNDTLLYAWRHWDRVRGLESPEGYLYVAARRRVMTRERPRPLLQMPDPAVLPDVEPGLVAALESLTEMQRQVVYLVEGFGWGLTDVARMLDISVSTVRNHHARGLTRLRALLAAEVDCDA
jgi:DNA-directed RNA polymerase specialized sigma24 family protein